MNWLARLEVDAAIARDHRIWDSYAWHRRLWEGCFPNAPNMKRDFLTRVDNLEGAFRLWVLAQRKPQRPGWCPDNGFSLKKIAGSFLSHNYYAFDLRANPVKTVSRKGTNGEILYRPDGKRRSGKRIPLVKEDELCAWLERKGKARCRDQKTGLDIPGGFRILKERPLEISPMVARHFRKSVHSAYHGGVRFRGSLEVTDSERFTETYRCGIGSAKSFGFGLLLLAPIIL